MLSNSNGSAPGSPRLIYFAAARCSLFLSLQSVFHDDWRMKVRESTDDVVIGPAEGNVSTERISIY